MVVLFGKEKMVISLPHTQPTFMKKNPALAAFLFIAFALNFCATDPLINNQTLDPDASSRTIVTDITTTLPNSAVALNGSLLIPTKQTFTSYQWSKVSGPTPYVIVAPTLLSTKATNLVEGIYVFRLTVRGASNQSLSYDLTVRVKSARLVNSPTISSISPMCGTAGNVVVITGTNFDATPLVDFNGTRAVVTSSTATSIITSVPGGAATGAVTVTSHALSVMSASAFTILPPPPTSAYFKGKMENVTITTNYSRLVFNGWPTLRSNALVEGFVINNIGGTQYATEQIVQDPVDPARKSMAAHIINDDPNVSGTTRAQMTLNFKDATNLPIYHTSHRMYLNPDINYLQNYSSATYWFEIFEIWNKHVATWDGDGAGSCRWNLSLLKDDGVGQHLYWVIRAEYMQPANIAYQRMWNYVNKNVPIPYGKWFTLDMYMKRGEGANGRMTITITPDGGQRQLLFDVINTTIYPGHPEIHLKSWQPFKLYLDDKYLDWMSTNGKSISAYYNDFAWYRN